MKCSENQQEPRRLDKCITLCYKNYENFSVTLQNDSKFYSKRGSCNFSLFLRSLFFFIWNRYHQVLNLVNITTSTLRHRRRFPIIGIKNTFSVCWFSSLIVVIFSYLTFWSNNIYWLCPMQCNSPVFSFVHLL